jgi:hypothetical protein
MFDRYDLSALVLHEIVTMVDELIECPGKAMAEGVRNRVLGGTVDSRATRDVWYGQGMMALHSKERGRRL